MHPWVDRAAMAVALGVGLILVLTWLPGLHPSLHVVQALRPHLGLVLVLAAGGLAVGHRSGWVLVAALVGMGHLGAWVPFPRSAPAPSAETVRVLTWNALYRNDDTEAALAGLLDVHADVVVVHEATRRWATALAPLADTLPHAARLDTDGPFGIALWSRYPLLEVRSTPWDREAGCASIEAVLDVAGQPVTLVALHPSRPIDPGGVADGYRCAARLAYLRGEAMPVVVAGDLNATPWMSLFAALRHATGTRPSLGGRWPQPTWAPTWAPRWLAATGLLGLPLDHVLVSKGVAIQGRTVGPRWGSDHRALWVDLSF